MRCQYQNTSPMNELIEPFVRLVHEIGVTGTDAFIKKKNFRFDAGRHCEGQTRLHSRRIGAHRKVEKPSQLGKFRDAVAPREDLGSRQSEVETAENDVFVAGAFRVD